MLTSSQAEQTHGVAMLRVGDIEYPSLKGRVSAEEWLARVELAALYRLVVMLGMDDMSITHCSAQVGEHYLFNPSGFLFEEITASSLVKIDLQGQIVAETPFQIVEGGWYPMKAVHAARPDAKFVIHTHDNHGIALSAQRRKLLPIAQSTAFALADQIAYHDYDGVETYEDRVAGLQASLGSANRMILHNHGLLVLGQTARQTLYRLYSLNKACQVQLLAGPTEELIQIPEDILETFPAELKRAQGNNPWPGLLRKLDRLDPSSKD